MRDLFLCHGAGGPSRVPRLLAGLLLCGALLLPTATPADATAFLDWADPGVVWPNGTLGPHSYTLSNGVIVTITVEVPLGTSGSFEDSIPEGGGSETPTPREDCSAGLPECMTNHLFGTSHNLGVVFNPDSGTAPVSSPILLLLSFSEPVTDLTFEISDIDFSQAGTQSGAEGHRLDRVAITSNAGDPTLTYKAHKVGITRTFTIAGNTATANCTGRQPTCDERKDTTDGEPKPGHNLAPDAGTVVVDFGALAVTTVKITYTEAGNSPNPAGRGIGLFGHSSLTPVELMDFTVD